MTANVPMMESGTAAPGMRVAVRFRRNRKMTNTTRQMVRTRVNSTSWIDPRIDFDASKAIRGSIHDVEFTLVLTICLVVLVIFLFLRNLTATLIPGAAVPLSIIGTFAVMYLLGYSLNYLSLMALTLSVGYVVDDAVVMLENIVR